MRLKNLIKYQSGGLTVDKIQDIINRYGNGKSPLTANDYIEVSKSTGVPVDLLLAQGIQESNFGTKGRAVRTKNVGNVGNTDDGTANYQNSWKNGLFRQATLLKNEYKVNDSSDIQRLVSNDFVRPTKGGKYASDPNYGSSIGKLLNSIHGKKVYDLNGGTSTVSTISTPNYAQYNTPIDSNMKPVDWSKDEYTSYLDNIYKYDFNTLPTNLQQTVLDNQKLQNDKLNQEVEADRLQKENMAIEQSLQQKASEREQLIASIPQAEFVGSNLQRSDYNQLLQAPAPTFQQGGEISPERRKIMDKGAKQTFNWAVKEEKEYLQGNKIRERLKKAGMDPDAEIKRLTDKLNTVKLSVDDTDYNTNGAYYNDNNTEIKYANDSATNVNSDTMSHEVGHIFGRSNIKNREMIDDRNALVEDGGLAKAWQKTKLIFSDDYRSSDGHEVDWEEMVADVHSARDALKFKGYDGRFSNFTNEAYNGMRRFANEMPDSAVGRLFRKVGTPETNRYQNLKLQMQFQQLDKTGLPKEDQEFLKDYEKNKTKYESIQKRYMFDIMNKVVSNDTINSEDKPMYAQMGGQVNGDGINNVLSKLNPKNWFKTDYSDKGTYSQAYSAARNDGELEFMYKGKRYNTNYNGTPQQQLQQTGLTDAQRQSRNIAQNRLQQNLNPFDYSNMERRVFSTVIQNKKEKDRVDNENDPSPNYLRRKDAFNLYTGKPQVNNTFSISEHRPSKETNKDAIYYSMNDKGRIFEELIDKARKFSKDPKSQVIDNNLKKVIVDDKGSVMGNYTISTGTDKRGKFVSYYDLWDLNPINFGKPFEIYDKFYYNDYPNSFNNGTNTQRMYYNENELMNMNPASDKINVKNLQRELAQRGYNLDNSIIKNTKWTSDEKYDGILGDETKAALEKFRNDQKNKNNE